MANTFYADSTHPDPELFCGCCESVLVFVESDCIMDDDGDGR